MNQLVSPVLTADIGGIGLRFFASPEAGPHLPWHAIDDLFNAMKFPRRIRRDMMRIARGTAGKNFKTVATVEGLVVIGSHPMAQIIIEVATETRRVRADFEQLYNNAAVRAMLVMTDDLEPLAKMQLLIESACNTLYPMDDDQ